MQLDNDAQTEIIKNEIKFLHLLENLVSFFDLILFHKTINHNIKENLIQLEKLGINNFIVNLKCFLNLI